MDKKDFDFCGWASRNNIKCSDGRVIKKDAFKDQNGKKVPLVWNHDHQSAENVLGHAILENREEGVYTYCSFNDQEQANIAKGLVQHGDITSLSIYANKLKQNGSDVIHGCIREVSLVLAGANPGAYIENVLEHGETDSNSAKIFNSSEELIMSEDYQEPNNLKQSDNTNIEGDKVVDEEKDKTPDLNHADKEVKKEDDKETINDVINTMTDKQKDVMYAMVALALDEQNEPKKEEKEGDKNMKHNAFDKDNNKNNNENVITHSEILEIIAEAKKSGSLKDAALAHSIEDITVLFPEVQAVGNVPSTISTNKEWVSKIMSSVSKSPFSRIKSLTMDITAESARAKGYVKGSQKVEEVIRALKRTTTPATIYKLQKIDRDDVIDITDFDVVLYLKSEMRAKLDEELARAFIIGDQRSESDEAKINSTNIRPVLGDDVMYTVPRVLEKDDNATSAEFAKSFIIDIIRARKLYKGSGNPTLYTTEDMLTEMLLIEDTTGRAIYDTIDKLTTKLRVKEIVTIPQMDDAIRRNDEETYDYKCLGILVNMNDYVVGASKGGQVAFFDDFDLNFNKYEYLIETRCCGALTVPYSAISFEQKIAVEVIAEG